MPRRPGPPGRPSTSGSSGPSVDGFDRRLFEQQLGRALERVRLVLDATRHPRPAAEVHHRYVDKYLLAESMTQAALASHVNCLAELGLRPEQLRQLQGWAQSHAVSFHFRSQEQWAFLREETREVEDPQRHEVGIVGAIRAVLTSKVVTRVTEYFWKCSISYEVTAVRGVGASPEDRVTLFGREGEQEVVTLVKEPPRRPQTNSCEVNVSWFLRQFRPESCTPHFRIDRDHPKCHTPRRNPEVDAATVHFTDFDRWLRQVMQTVADFANVGPEAVASLFEDVLVPVLPLLDEQPREVSEAATGAAAAAVEEQGTGPLALLPSVEREAESLLLGSDDANRLLEEEARALSGLRAKIAEHFPAALAAEALGKVMTAAEVLLLLVSGHITTVCIQWKSALAYIEDMLRKQLIAAIGKEVRPADFADYMRFHNRKLFAEAYAPAPFSFAVRRSARHSPEGIVSIEQVASGGGGETAIPEPIITIVSRGDRPHPMRFPLSASTNVPFGGDRYLHAWLAHQFSGESGAKLSLVARTRQFSSMIVLVGRIASAQVFEPKFAAILQNKDELAIPLELATIPTPKEFKDAIASLSPEQRSFAEAFRSMQLESTLFGVLVLQIKPQLEKVLNLPEDGLTKEIKLTQDLMQLFIKYQIPSDLLSFDAATSALGSSASPQQRIETVKRHVEAMQWMIEASKQEQLEERRMEAQYANPLPRPPPPRPVLHDQLEVLEEKAAMLEVRSASFHKKSKKSSLGFGLGRALASAGSAAYDALPSLPAITLGGGSAGGPPRSMSSMPRGQARLQGGGDFEYTIAAKPEPSSDTSRGPGQASSEAPRAKPPASPSSAPPQDSGSSPSNVASTVLRDYTQVPKEMDQRFEQLDTDGALRPTIITPGSEWQKRAQKALLAAPTTSTLKSEEQKREKDAAFDLLDALTKSGALPFENASLHIVVAATHCFDKTITETVIQDNVNPIDKVERSTLIMASTVHQRPPAALINEAQRERVGATSPLLFGSTLDAGEGILTL